MSVYGLLDVKRISAVKLVTVFSVLLAFLTAFALSPRSTNAAAEKKKPASTKQNKQKKKKKRKPALPAGSNRGAVAPLSSEGHLFVDAAGRTVQLRGVNPVSKSDPYYPEADGFGSDDATMLAAQGFNVVRLGVDFRGLMPAPGKPSDTYIKNLAKTVDALSDAGIYTLVDFHQDGFSPKYNGNGFPDWWAIDDGLANPDVAFPAYYLLNPAMQRAFEHFWMNSEVAGKGIQDWFLDGMKAVVRKFRSNSRVIGYEAFNEPWPGADWSTCLNPDTGCPDQEQELIAPFVRKAVAMTRKLTRTQPVFTEPFVLFNFGTPTSLPGDTGAWLSVHDYAATPANNIKVVEQANAAAERDQKPVLLTEFGATNDGPKLDRLTGNYDAGLISWIFWAYDENVVTNQTVPTTSSVANQTVLKALTRPYPVAVTGTPTSLSFDPATRVMNLSYTKRRPGGGKYDPRLQSVIAVQRFTYPDGYSVQVTGATVKSKPCAGKLLLRNGPDRKKPVNVTVTPGGECI